MYQAALSGYTGRSEYIMTQNEVKQYKEKYNMDVLQDQITNEFLGFFCDTDNEIPELDKLADNNFASARFNSLESYPCIVVRELFCNVYRYKIICPSNWFDSYNIFSCSFSNTEI